MFGQKTPHPVRMRRRRIFEVGKLFDPFDDDAPGENSRAVTVEQLETLETVRQADRVRLRADLSHFWKHPR